jgi:hypothetical protein
VLLVLLCISFGLLYIRMQCSELQRRPDLCVLSYL